MHTFALREVDFDITVDGRSAGLVDILPDYSLADRLGIVVVSPLGALEASGLVLAAVASYYDALRNSDHRPPAYPDIFTFHVGRPWGDHSMLDVWPTRKEVVVSGLEELLDAISDRAITFLAIPGSRLAEDFSPGRVVELGVGTRELLRGCFEYAVEPGGGTGIATSPLTADWIRGALDPELAAASARAEGVEHFPYAATIDARAHELSEAERAQASDSWTDRLDAGWTREWYRSVPLGEVSSRLATRIPRGWLAWAEPCTDTSQPPSIPGRSPGST